MLCVSYLVCLPFNSKLSVVLKATCVGETRLILSKSTTAPKSGLRERRSIALPSTRTMPCNYTVSGSEIGFLPKRPPLIL